MKKIFIGFLCAGIANLQAMHEVGRGMHDINDPFSTLPSHFSDPRPFHKIGKDESSRPKTTGKDGTTGTSGTTGKPDPKTGKTTTQPVAKPVAGEPGVARSSVDAASVAGSKDGSGVARNVIDDAGGDRTIGGSANPQPKPRTAIESITRWIRDTLGLSSKEEQVKNLSLDVRLAKTPAAKKKYATKIENIFMDMKAGFDVDMQEKLKLAANVSTGAKEVMEFFVSSDQAPIHQISELMKTQMLLNVDNQDFNPMENYKNLVTLMKQSFEYYDKCSSEYPKVIEVLSAVKDSAGHAPGPSHSIDDLYLTIINPLFYSKFVNKNMHIPADVNTLFNYIINGNKIDTAKIVARMNTDYHGVHENIDIGTVLLTDLKTVIKTYLDTQIKILDTQIEILDTQFKISKNEAEKETSRTQGETLSIQKIILTGLKTQVLA